MKKILCFLSIITIISPAFAEGEAVNKATVAAAASYVDGAYNALNSAKQDTLTSTNVVESGSGAVVTGVSASNGTVTVTKGEVTIPVGSASSSTRATIWVQ